MIISEERAVSSRFWTKVIQTILARIFLGRELKEKNSRLKNFAKKFLPKKFSSNNPLPAINSQHVSIDKLLILYV